MKIFFPKLLFAQIFLISILLYPFFFSASYAFQPPDARFGLDLAVINAPTLIYPVNGNLRFNKNQYLVNNFISPLNYSSWSFRELNSGNKTELIQTSFAFYIKKSQLKDKDIQPGWINSQDILGLGFTDWSSVPDDYPIWDPGNVNYDSQQNTLVKNEFPAGTSIIKGWLDINNVCRKPGERSIFWTKPEKSQNESLLVLKGAFGDATPAPGTRFVEPCDVGIYRENDFINFVSANSNQNMTYIVFNEMVLEDNLENFTNADAMTPDLYVHFYKQYYNLIKGHPGCSGNGLNVPSQAALDSQAKVVVGNPAIYLSSHEVFTDYYRNPYLWWHEFYQTWLSYANGPNCTLRGPFQYVVENGNKKIPTDGVPIYLYSSEAVSEDNVCVKFNNWINLLTSIISKIRQEFSSEFSDTTIILNEYGIQSTYTGSENDSTYNAALLELINWWLKQTGFSSELISHANWLTTYSYLNWKKTQGTIPLAKITIGGDQLLINEQGGTRQFGSKLAQSFWQSIRGSYQIINEGTLSCGKMIHCLPLGDHNCSGEIDGWDISKNTMNYQTNLQKTDLDGSGINNSLDFKFGEQ